MNHAARMQRLLDGLDGPLLVSSLINVRYLTGFTGSNAYIYATPDGATFVTDGRYGEVAAGLVDALPATDLLVYRAAGGGGSRSQIRPSLSSSHSVRPEGSSSYQRHPTQAELGE